ncbi:MAG: TonB family protein, partial [Nitrospiraceae bacterium]
PIRPADPVVSALQPKQRMQAVSVPKRRQSSREREPVKVEPSPPPPQRSFPTPREPASAPVLSEPPARKQQVEKQLKSALGEIEQPPVAPDLRSHRPVERRAPSPQAPPRDLNVQKVLKTLPEVPDLSSPPVPEPKSKPEATTKSRIAEDVAKQLSELERPTPEEETSKDLTIASKRPSLRKPLTNIKVPGAGTGLNKYLAVVQAKISRRWAAPPVDLRDRSLQVVVQFRLHRDGHITDVAIERSSGNGYYDDAGKRAVQAADPLPSFPAHMEEQVLDAHFSFTVGNGAG